MNISGYTADNNFIGTVNIDGDMNITGTITGGGGGGGGGDVKNPMTSNLSAGGFNITNIGNVQATTFNGGSILTNPLSSALIANNNNITGASNIQTSTINGLNPSLFLVNPLTSALVVNSNNITGSNLVEVKTITSGTVGVPIIINEDITTKSIMPESALISYNIGSSAIPYDIVTALTFEATGIKAHDGYTEIIILNDLNLDDFSLKRVTTVNTRNLNEAIVGQGVNLLSNMTVSNKNINGANIVQAKTISSGSASAIDVTSDLTMTGKNITGLASLSTNALTLTGFGSVSLNNLTSTGNLLINPAQNLILQPQGGEVECNSALNLFDNNLIGVGSLFSQNLSCLDIQSGAASPIIVNSGLDLKGNAITNASGILTNPVNTTLNINNNLITNMKALNGVTHIYANGQLPASLTGIYVIDGNITCPLALYTLSGDTTIIGYGVSQSSLTFTVGGVFTTNTISCVDFSLTLINVRLTNQTASQSLLTASNFTRTKNITMTNCEISNCRNQSMIDISGFDLVDFNNCMLSDNYTSVYNVSISGPNSLQISGCEFKRNFNKLIPAQYGTAPLITLSGGFQTISINNNVIIPLETQDGVRLVGGTTATQILINDNMLNSSLLTSGLLINYTLASFPQIRFTGNSGVMNEKALLQFSNAGNSTFTPTVAGNFVAIDFGASFLVSDNIRWSPSITPFSFNYIGTYLINCLVSISMTVDHSTTGQDICAIAIFKNNQIYGQSMEFNDVATQPQTITFSKVLRVGLNELLQFRIVNISAGTNVQGFRVISCNASFLELN